MKMIFWAGIFFFIGSIALVAANYKTLNIERKGRIVEMQIMKVPKSCLGTRIKHFVTLSYKGEEFIKRVGGSFCDEHNPGEFISVKYLEGHDEVLFPGETVKSNLISFVVLGVLGVSMIIYYKKKYS